jgi:hypothetical protein
VHAKGKRLSPVAQAFISYIREERAQISTLSQRFDGALPLSTTGS